MSAIYSNTKVIEVDNPADEIDQEVVRIILKDKEFFLDKYTC